MFKRILIILVCLLIVSACGIFTHDTCGLFDSRHCSSDSFFRSNGEIDLLRVPLLEPYEVIKSGSGGWQVDLYPSDLKESTNYHFISDVEKIAVNGDTVLVYTSIDDLTKEQLKQKSLHWFVVIPSKQIEKGFEQEENFLEYKEQADMSPIEWMEPMEAFKVFEATGCLPWVPDYE